MARNKKPKTGIASVMLVIADRDARDPEVVNQRYDYLENVTAKGVANALRLKTRDVDEDQLVNAINDWLVTALNGDALSLQNGDYDDVTMIKVPSAPTVTSLQMSRRYVTEVTAKSCRLDDDEIEEEVEDDLEDEEEDDEPKPKLKKRR